MSITRTTTFGHSATKVIRSFPEPAKGEEIKTKIVMLGENNSLRKAGIDRFELCQLKDTKALKVFSKWKEVSSAYLCFPGEVANLKNFFKAIRKFGLRV